MGTESFLRPSSELSVRFCFICFDGSKTLKQLQIMKDSGLEIKEYDEQFVRENCSSIVIGIERLKKFVQNYKTI